ncbi:ribbon-helix-helix protein, CopG family [Candidatus Nanohalovita haloferacivicina]|nr:hypothetical protein HBNXNv_0360 [Candidatus Nanohalobia archaeon BNXNv]
MNRWTFSVPEELKEHIEEESEKTGRSQAEIVRSCLADGLCD